MDDAKYETMRRLIKDLNDENEYLRSENNELSNRLKFFEGQDSFDNINNLIEECNKAKAFYEDAMLQATAARQRYESASKDVLEIKKEMSKEKNKFLKKLKKM